MSLEDKARLERTVSSSMKKIFKDCLSYLEFANLEKSQYERIRKMVLRSGNDEIRKINQELEKYDVSYTPRYDEQIDFKE
jgi:molecular chaperone DnaK (HSP70)